MGTLHYSTLSPHLSVLYSMLYRPILANDLLWPGHEHRVSERETIFSYGFLNWKPFEDVKHNSSHLINVWGIYPRLGIVISQSFKENKKNIFEYMHPSTPLPMQQQTVSVCLHAELALG